MNTIDPLAETRKKAKETLAKRGSEEWRLANREYVWNRGIRLTLVAILILICPFIGAACFPVLIVAFILLGIDLTTWFSNKWGRLVWPNRAPSDTPNYTIPEGMVAHGRYAEAEEEYERIIKEYPREIKPHIALIDLAVMRLNDGETADKLYARGMGILKDKDARETLTRMYQAIRSRLKTPENSSRTPIQYRKVEHPEQYWR